MGEQGREGVGGAPAVGSRLRQGRAQGLLRRRGVTGSCDRAHPGSASAVPPCGQGPATTRFDMPTRGKVQREGGARAVSSLQHRCRAGRHPGSWPCSSHPTRTLGLHGGVLLPHLDDHPWQGAQRDQRQKDPQLRKRERAPAAMDSWQLYLARSIDATPHPGMQRIPMPPSSREPVSPREKRVAWRCAPWRATLDAPPLRHQCCKPGARAWGPLRGLPHFEHVISLAHQINFRQTMPARLHRIPAGVSVISKTAGLGKPGTQHRQHLASISRRRPGPPAPAPHPSRLPGACSYPSSLPPPRASSLGPWECREAAGSEAVPRTHAARGRVWADGGPRSVLTLKPCLRAAPGLCQAWHTIQRSTKGPR